MSFIFKQMLNNINTDIEALQLEDINIGIGGAALGEGISNLQTALNDHITYTTSLGDMLFGRVNINKALIDNETIRSVEVDDVLTGEVARLTDEVNQVIEDIKHYGFRVCGTTYQNCNNGHILVFDNNTRTDYGCHVVPDAAAYNTSTYKYTVPSNGYWFFGFNLFMNSNPNDSDRRFGIYVNNAIYAFGGTYIGTGETVSLNKYCVQGDIIDVRCYIGPATVSLNPGHSWFYGWKIN